MGICSAYLTASGGKNVIGSALQTIKHFVNTYSFNKYLLRADYVLGIVPLQLLPSLPTLHLFSSITGYQFQMQLVYGLKSPTHSPSFVPNEVSVTCLHQETLYDMLVQMMMGTRVSCYLCYLKGPEPEKLPEPYSL